MDTHGGDEEPTSAGRRRRWFLGLEPILVPAREAAS